MSEIDISTHQLCEQVCSSFGTKKLSLDMVMKVWHAMGTVIKSQLLQKRGVRLDKFGTFSFARSREPIFNIASDFAQLYRLQQSATPTMDNISSAKLNLTQLASVSGVARATSDKIYNRFIQCIGKCAQSGRNVLVTLNKVGEVTISARAVKYEFMQDFMNDIGVGRNNIQGPSNGLKATKINKLSSLGREAGWNAKDYEAPDARAIAREAKKALKQAKNEKILSIPRPRNPMTDGDEEKITKPRRPRERNPVTGEAGEEELVPKVNKMSLTQENLNRVDTRQVDAKAILRSMTNEEEAVLAKVESSFG